MCFSCALGCLSHKNNLLGGWWETLQMLAGPKLHFCHQPAVVDVLTRLHLHCHWMTELWWWLPRWCPWQLLAVIYNIIMTQNHLHFVTGRHIRCICHLPDVDVRIAYFCFVFIIQPFVFRQPVVRVTSELMSQTLADCKNCSSVWRWRRH